MPTELREMLHDAVQDPPYDGTDPGELLTAGRRRVRARRTAIAVAAGTAAVVVAAIVGLAPRLGHFDPGPVGPVQPVGKVVHLSAAVDAVRGRDYRVLVRSDSGNLDRANGISLGPVADDGAVFVQDGPHGMHNVTRFGILDPTKGTTAWLTLPPVAAQASLRFVGIDRDRVLLSGEGASTRTVTLWSYARGSGDWTRVDVDTSGTGFSSFTLRLDGDRVYSSGQPAQGGGSTYRAGLWSAPLTPSSVARDEKVQVGTFDVDDGVLTYMAYDNRPTSELHVRDLATGEDRTFDSRSGRHCNQLGLQRIGDDVALWQFCGEHHGVRDDRLQVVTATGAPVVTIQGDDLEGTAMSPRFVSVMSMNGRAPGTYVYDLHDGRLLRVSDGWSHFASLDGGAGDRLTWSTPNRGGHGRTQWVADFR